MLGTSHFLLKSSAILEYTRTGINTGDKSIKYYMNLFDFYLSDQIDANVGGGQNNNHKARLFMSEEAMLDGIESFNYIQDKKKWRQFTVSGPWQISTGRTNFYEIELTGKPNAQIGDGVNNDPG